MTRLPDRDRPVPADLATEDAAAPAASHPPNSSPNSPPNSPPNSSPSPQAPRTIQNSETDRPKAEHPEIEHPEINAPAGLGAALRNRNFLVLWSGQVFSQLADKVYLVMAVALLASHFQRSGQAISGWVSAVMIAFTIPAVLLGSLAGVYVDRWSKKAVLTVTNLVRGGLVLGLPVLLWLSADWPDLPLGDFGVPAGFVLLLVVTFLVSSLTQFFAPAEQAAMPLIVEPRHLLPANSLYTTTMVASVVVGFALGEPLLALANAVVTHWGGNPELGQELVVGGGYAIAGAILLLLRTGETQHLEEREFPHFFEDIRDGLRYVGDRPRLRNAMIQMAILFSIFAALAVLAVRIAEVIPALKASQFGFLLAASGVGMGIGAAVLGHWGDRAPYRRWNLLGSWGVGVGLILLGTANESLTGAIAASAVIGFAAAFISIPMQTLIQKETDEAMRGKVFGLQNNLVNITLSLPLALASVAEAWLGLSTVLFSLAALIIAGGSATWYISVTASRTAIAQTGSDDC